VGTRADSKDGSCREVLTGKHVGKWRVQFTSADEFGRVYRISRIFPTKTEGKDFLRSLRRGEKVESARKRKELTLAGWFDWLVANDWPETLAKSTIAARVTRFEKYVRAEWGSVELARLDPIAMKSFYRELAEDGVGKPTVLEVKRDLVRVFNLAITPYRRVPWNSGNPFAVHVPTPQKREAVVLTPVEAAQAIRCRDLSPKDRALLATFLLGGLRLGEAMALTRGQLLFETGLIFVDRAVRMDPDRGQWIGLPKCDRRRLAVMCPTLTSILQEAFCGLEPDAFLWPKDTANEPRLKRNVYRTWDSIVTKAGLPGDLSPQDCRLSHVNWIEKLMPEVSPTSFKEHIGHAAKGVTEHNYTRPLAPAQEILRGAIERVIIRRTREG
jgi:integrase